MANFTAGTSFSDGVTNDVTAAKLNALVADAVPTSNLSLNSTTGTIANFTASTANITLGTIPTLTAGTTTGTAGVFTSGTITTGLIPTLTAGTTTGTAGVFTSGTITTLNSTTPTFLGAITASTNTINVGSGQIFKDSSGSVGIGTASPVSVLDISNASDTSERAIKVQNSSCNLFVGVEGTSANRFSGSSANNAFLGTTTADGIEFATNNTVRTIIDSSGRVGIGTSSPHSSYRASLTGDGSTIIGGLVLSSNSNVTYIGATGATVADSEIWNSANGYVRIGTNNTERLRIDSSGNVGVGTASPGSPLVVSRNANDTLTRLILDNPNAGSSAQTILGLSNDGGTVAGLKLGSSAYSGLGGANVLDVFNNASHTIFSTIGTERLRIDSSGNLLVGKTVLDIDVAGSYSEQSGRGRFTTNSAIEVLTLNRQDSDGIIVDIRQANTSEGSISVSGTTVSYNGGHLSRWSQLLSGQRDASIKKGTVMSNLNEMCEWFDKDGNLLPNEQLNKVKVSDIEGESNVAGVFVNWDDDDKDNPFDLNMAMTGDMIIRIAQGTSVNRGDLLMSAGDGTTKPQGDDIIRSKTIAKVTSTNVTCTYEDGSYCVPCVLMAC